MAAGTDLRVLRAAVFAAVCVALSAAGHALAADAPLPLWTFAVAFGACFAVAVPLAGRERSLPGIAALLAGGQLLLHALFSCGPRGHAGPTGSAHAGDGGGLVAFARQLICGEPSAGGPMTESRARRIVAEAGISPADAAARGGAAPGVTDHPPHGAPGFAEAPLECLRGAARTVLASLDGPMLLGHLCAALLLGLLLRRGDAALGQLIRLSRWLPAHAAEAARELLTVRALRTALGLAAALSGALTSGAPVHPAGAAADGLPAPRSAELRHSVRRRGPPLPASTSYLLAA
ncbi:hypothetical protein E0L36_18135 [Streptomyces sp. AJS327]|uniref:hypothetical protein n=1 Tax=Streptomyces sp. AJS327 TaxID=2545265 RepID=UPI0015DE1D65|nr:hypothetical protein [Streptomyces sp. AJS327]MBA0052725.1 hypothetical protein [Streptomyces sp. AJS327]